MDIVRLLAVACCVFGGVACATYAGVTPERVDRVPAGQYRVVVSETHAGSHQYSAVLFNLATPLVRLDLPAVERNGVASPDDYAALIEAGFVVYEIRGDSGAAQAYLLVPPHARVTVWSRPGRRSGPVVTVTDLPGAPEAAGGGGDSM